MGCGARRGCIDRGNSLPVMGDAVVPSSTSGLLPGHIRTLASGAYASTKTALRVISAGASPRGRACVAFEWP